MTRLGSHSGILGNAMINPTTARVAMIKGIDAIEIAPNLTFAIGMATKRLVPNGGVTKPISAFKTKMMPKTTGSTPTASMIVKYIGVIMMICAIVFIHMPIKISQTLIRMRATAALAVTPKIPLLTIWGI